MDNNKKKNKKKTNSEPENNRLLKIKRMIIILHMHCTFQHEEGRIWEGKLQI